MSSTVNRIAAVDGQVARIIYRGIMQIGCNQKGMSVSSRHKLFRYRIRQLRMQLDGIMD